MSGLNPNQFIQRLVDVRLGHVTEGFVKRQVDNSSSMRACARRGSYIVADNMDGPQRKEAHTHTSAQ